MRKKINMYMTVTALRMRRKKEKQWKRYLFTGQAHHYVAYTRTRDTLRKVTRKLKKDFERNLVLQIKENPKAFWSYVKTKTKTRVTVESLIRGDGTVAETDREKADVLNRFFSSVFTKENLATIPQTNGIYNGPLLEDVVITPEEVADKLMSLNPNKSPGPDQIHPRVLKEVSGPISVPLSQIFRKSLENGRLPEQWK